MSDSLLFYVDRSDELHVIDPDALPDHKFTDAAQDIGIAVLKAGYKGVVVDGKKLSSGKCFAGWNFDLATPEGRVLKKLFLAAIDGVQPPSANIVLRRISVLYARD